MSKLKGNNFERKIAKIFNDRFRHLYKDKDSFRRSITSGGFFGGKNSKKSIIDEHKIDIGDIMTPPGFRFTIECKFYKTPFTINILHNFNSQLDKWLKQAEEQSKLANKDFLLIIKFNDIKEIVITKKLLVSNINYIYYNSYYIYSLESLLNLKDEIWFLME